jgi:hypothetical protein
MSKQKQQPEYEKVGRIVVSIAETGYANKSKLYRMSFLKGFLSGVGGVLGATIGIALLLFLLSLFNEVPFVGDIAESLSQTINTTQ